MNSRILPVIHLLSPAQAVEQAALALDAGADGVFLIDHGGSAAATREALQAVRSELGEVWVGVNLLSRALPAAAVEVAEWGVQGLWGDDAGIDERRGVDDQPAGESLRRAARASGFAGEVFGGVAFKYQRPVPEADLAQAGRIGAEFLDVVTTSGVGTGSAASLTKLRALREGVGERARLGVASGVDVSNIRETLEIVDDILVASSVCADFHHFDPHLLEALLCVPR